jgi:signal transduction histidine kinase
LAFSAVPLAFAIGVVREGLDRSAVGDLIVQLTASEGEGDLRNMMAVALRDPTLELIYWLDNRGVYVDRDGRPSDPPRPTSTRAVTYVTHGERRVAALVHDPFLKREDELLKGVCAAAALSLANERLQAELKARLEDLRKSRARIVHASDAERRRVERNLHDGAQQRLLSLSLSLQDAERRTSDPEAARIIHEARGELARTVTELRDLAQGLHPAVLVDHGLAVALESSVASSAIPTQLRVAVDAPIPPQIEVAAYYVVTEALVNIAKHSHANRATVEVSTRNGDLVVEVADDGVGGADFSSGSGLLGLSDRVGALDGRLEVSDRPGGGTTVRAEMPCG